ncbi:transmembrane protein 6/97 [Gautieria morchelliformis]|nr:transmembrane protein 6/97 [Gautieria morchelliformis]
MARRPLKSRPLDLIYFTFFLIHIPATLLIDVQALYPQSLVPEFTKKFISFYVSMSGDPLIAGANHFYGSDHVFTWFRSFLWLEILFQFPVFVLGARALWKDSPAIYLLLLVYGASTATTTLPCLTTVLAVPTAEDARAAVTTVAVTDAQRLLLLSSYVPFLLVPLIMTLDMAWRVSKMIDLTKDNRTSAAVRIKRDD